MLGQGFEGISLDQAKAGFVLEFMLKPANETLVQFIGLDGMTDGQKRAGQGAQSRSDFLHRFRGGLGQRMSNDRGQSGFRQKVLPQLAERTKADLLLTDPPYGIDYGNQLIKGEEFNEKTNKHGWHYIVTGKQIGRAHV